MIGRIVNTFPNKTIHPPEIAGVPGRLELASLEEPFTVVSQHMVDAV